jgi:hypothetical protein
MDQAGRGVKQQVRADRLELLDADGKIEQVWRHGAAVALERRKVQVKAAMFNCPFGCGASKAEHICFPESDTTPQEKAMRLRIKQLQEALAAKRST